MRALKVTVITPSFQQGKFIERTIQSVLSQNISELEYFIFDGGSTDQTLQILKQYENQLSWISELDSGQANAVNKGFKKASGDIIGWLNSDDIYYPNAIKTVCDFFNAHPEVDIVYGQANHIDEDDHLIELYPTEEWNLERLKQTCFISQPAVFFRKTLFDKVGFLNESLNYCMDYEFWLRLAQAGAKFKYLPVVLAGSRLHDATKTLSAPIKAQYEAMSMLRQTVGKVSSTWLISYAVAYLKQKSHRRFPQWRFVLDTWMLASWMGVRYNGLVRGVVGVFTLPCMMVWFYCKRRSN